MEEEKQTRKKLTKLFTFSGHGLITIGLLKLQSFWFWVIRNAGIAGFLRKHVGKEHLYEWCKDISGCLASDTLFAIGLLLIAEVLWHV